MIPIQADSRKKRVESAPAGQLASVRAVAVPIQPASPPTAPARSASKGIGGVSLSDTVSGGLAETSPTFSNRPPNEKW